MHNGLASFDEILEGVKIETGITNLRNMRPQIRKMVADAEKEINPYNGLMIKKRMVHFIGNGVFDGRSIKKPEDFVMLDEVGCCEDGLCNGQYFHTPGHIVITDGIPRAKITWVYWGLQYDGEGNPVSTEGHMKAVVLYIKWKLYSPKVWSGQGSAQLEEKYKRDFEDKAGQCRGEDFLSGMNERTMNRLYYTNQMSSLDMSNMTTADYCASCEMLTTIEEELSPSVMNVYFWQMDNPATRIEEVITLMTPQYLTSKPSVNYSVFAQGYIVPYISVGRICFAIQQTPLANWLIVDQLNKDITDEFDYTYFPETNTMLFVSKNHYSHSTMYFKFKNLENLGVLTPYIPAEPAPEPDVDNGTFDNTFDETFN